MKKCNACGAEIASESNFCPFCGSADLTVLEEVAVEATEAAEPEIVKHSPQDYIPKDSIYNDTNPEVGATSGSYYEPQTSSAAWENPNSSAPKMTKKDFFKQPGMGKFTGNCIASACIVFFCAAVTFMVGALLDVLILAACGVLILVLKSRVAAICLTVYGVLNVIIMISLTGVIGGWLPLVAGIYGIVATFMYQKKWNEYNKQ